MEWVDLMTTIRSTCSAGAEPDAFRLKNTRQHLRSRKIIALRYSIRVPVLGPSAVQMPHAMRGVLWARP
jgi:hypothetical protein